MARLIAFETVSLDGYFVDATGGMGWTHDPAPDPAFDAFTRSNAEGGGTLVFGRVTYELMAGFWPTPMAAERDPVVTGQMNALPKIVFSRTLARADWANTTLVKGDLVPQMRRLKAESDRDMVILGSGSLVAQLTAAGLIDAWQLVVAPVVLGAGRTLFEGVAGPTRLELTGSRAFDSGKVLLTYAPGA